MEQDVISTGTRAFDPEALAEARRYSMDIMWSPENDAYIVSVPEIPGLLTHGVTHREAVAMGEDAIACWLNVMRGGETVIPEPRIFEQEYPPYFRHERDLAPSAFGAERVLALRRRLGVSQRVFAEALNASIGAVRAWEYGRRTPDGPTVRLLELVERQPELLFGANPAPKTGKQEAPAPAPVRIAG